MKNALRPNYILPVLIFLFCWSNVSIAEDFYWINGSGNWNDGSHWSITSGGSASGTVPRSGDNVIFNHLSMVDEFSTVHLSGDVTVNDLKINIPQYISFLGSGSDLKITGNVTIQSNVVFALGGEIQFYNETETVNTLQTGAIDFYTDLVFKTGKWELENHLKTEENHSISFENGEFESNGYTVHADEIIADQLDYKLDFSASHISAVERIYLPKGINNGEAAIYHISSAADLDDFTVEGDVFASVIVDCLDSPLELELVETSDYNGAFISCNGACDGEITVTATGTPGPFSYRLGSVGPFQDNPVFDGLCSGGQSVFVTDSSNELSPGNYYTCRIDLFLTEPFVLSIEPVSSVDITCPGICDGQASISPSGGTGTLDILWTATPTGETTSNPTTLCEGANPVELTDENGCTFTDEVFVAAPPPMVTRGTVSVPTCNGDCNGSISLDPAGGNGEPFTFEWSPVPASGDNTNPGDGFCAGTIDLTLRDIDGCEYDTTFIIIDPPVLSVSLSDVTQTSCPGTCDGAATANPIGGLGDYSYEWFDNATGLTLGIFDQTVNTLCAGEYFVIVTDDNGCSVTSSVIIIDDADPIILDVTPYPVSCFGLCDGSAAVDATGGAGGYTYSWTTFPAGVGVGATDSISGLCPGEYQIVVTDANGCVSAPVVVEVLEPSELSLIFLSGVDPSCYNECDGSATVVPTGGTPDYSFSWSPLPIIGDGTATASGLCGDQEYTVEVTDDNGCMATASTILAQPDEYEVASIVTNIDCFGDDDGAIAIVVISGGSGAGYTYSWSPTPPFGDGTTSVSGLTAGTWGVTIEDSEGCDTTVLFEIIVPDEFEVTAETVSDITCNGLCNGSVQATDIVGGTGTITVIWDDPDAQETLTAFDLCAGTYTVTATDENGCTTSSTTTVTEPDPYDITVTNTEIPCFSNCDGTATVNVISGGEDPYTILWDDPLAQETFTAIGLCAGTYNPIVTDNNNCDTMLTVVITEPTELTADGDIEENSCFGECTGLAFVVPEGGTGGYTFQWFDATTDLPIIGETNDSIFDLCPGDYYAIVTDGNGCTAQTETLSISELSEIVATVESTTDATCAVCDGTASISVTGGAGGYIIDWSPDPGSGEGTTDATGLCSGAYSVLITDANSCTETLTLSINDIALEVLDLDSVDVTCNGACDGQAIVNFVELDPPYTVEWIEVATGLTAGFGTTLPDLCAGEYLAIVTNASGCVSTGSIIINEYDAILGTITSTDASCFGHCDGMASVTVSGGVPPYIYDWGVPLPGSGEGTPNVIGLCSGPWEVVVTDDAGCVVTFTTTVDEPSDVSIDAESSSDISCFGLADGTASVIISGGTGPYSYEWFNCATGLPIGQTDPLATGLDVGDYQCIITDANGCSVSSSCLPVANADEITTIINVQNITCYGECDGLISVTPSGGAGTYFFQWLDENGDPIAGQTNDSLENVCSGLYNIEITDLNGCVQTFGPIDQTAPSSPWDVVVSQSDITCTGECDGTASVIVLDGNNPPYTYQWDDPLLQVTPTANFLCEGTYNVVISDAGVCDTTITIEIINSNQIFANPTDITNVACAGECTGEITVNPFGGTEPYTMNWSDSQTGDLASGLCPGPITLTITDASGCSIDTTLVIDENPIITTTSSFSNNTTCGLCNGSATINVSGGVGPYTYDWTPDPTSGEGTNNATGLCPGVVSVVVTDQVGCTITETFAISDVSSEVVTLSSTDESCFGACDGTASASYTCSDPVCTQEWFDAATGASIGVTSSTATDLCAGEYFFEVINGSGCVTVESIVIDGPAEIIANETITPLTCVGDNDAEIQLAPSGGSGSGYTYAWSPVPTNGDGTNEALDIGPGLWEVTVTDGDGCSELFSYNIENPDALVLTVDPTQPSCTGFCNGSILAAVSGGAGGFTFQWFEGGTPLAGETSSLLAGLCPGSYNVVVTDANGCTVTLPDPVIITDPVAITAPITAQDISCFGICDGVASVTISGGQTPYTVNWHNAVTDVLTGLTGETVSTFCEGSYYAVITDNNGCNFTTGTVDIAEPTELTATLSTTNSGCFGFCSGTANIVATGGTGAYSYEWLTISGDPIVGGTAPSVIDLCEGNYTIEVQDANGCSTGAEPFLIDGFDPIEADVFSNDADCGIANGTASVFTTSGEAPFTYQWFEVDMTPIAGETDMIILDIPSGIYFVTATDNNGCSETFMVTVNDAESANATFDAITNPSCFDECDGSIEVTITGANPPFAFSWNPDGIIAEDPTGLCAGDYILEVVDALGCTGFYDTTLVNPPEITIAPTITSTNCGECNGSIVLAVAGGTGDLTILWNNGVEGNTLTDLCSGAYQVTVTDETGCSITQSFEVTNSSGLTIDPAVTSISCAGSCDGSISVVGEGGTAPYEFLWLHNGSVTDNISDLCSGTYFVQITDATGCQNTIEINVPDPNPIESSSTMVNPSCGAGDGTINVMSSGGALPHTYLWNTGAPTASITGLVADVYTVTITDDNGCSVVETYTLSNLTAPTVELEATDVTCFEDCNGTIDTLSVIGGTPGFNFSWLAIDGTDLGITTPLIEDLCEGDYILQTEDAVGCISFQTGTVDSPDQILVNPLFVSDPLCNGDCDGFIVANPFGGTLPFTFLWDDPSAQTTGTASGLCARDYEVIMTDANGCNTSQTETIVEPDEIAIVVDDVIPATCYDSEDGGVSITTSGGNPDYTFEWSNATNGDVFVTEDLTDVLPLTYFLHITDANGCEYFDTVSVDTSIVVLAFAGADTSICNNTGYSLFGDSNIPTDAIYTWFDTTGTVLSDSSQLVLPPNDTGSKLYVLQVSFMGCIGYDTVQVSTYPPLEVDAGVDIDIFPNQVITIGGDPTTGPGNDVIWTPSDYLNDTTVTNPLVVKPLESGWYVVTATDINGCVGSDSMYVTVLPELEIPDGISPNADGKNDTWILDFIDQYPGVSISINVYNRWGELLYVADETYQDDWGGLTEEGKRLPAGTYYFVIEVDHEDFPDPVTGPLTIMW